MPTVSEVLIHVGGFAGAGSRFAQRGQLKPRTHFCVAGSRCMSNAVPSHGELTRSHESLWRYSHDSSTGGTLWWSCVSRPDPLLPHFEPYELRLERLNSCIDFRHRSHPLAASTVKVCRSPESRESINPPPKGASCISTRKGQFLVKPRNTPSRQRQQTPFRLVSVFGAAGNGAGRALANRRVEQTGAGTSMPLP